jgi:hypothetical protein
MEALISFKTRNLFLQLLNKDCRALRDNKAPLALLVLRAEQLALLEFRAQLE